MSIASFTSILRLAVTLIVTSVFLAMPIAEASHSDQPTSEACTEPHSAELEIVTDEDESSHDQHDHHAHKCGTCHVHLVIQNQSFVQTVVKTDLNLQISDSRFLTLGAPDLLYRPPRA